MQILGCNLELFGATSVTRRSCARTRNSDLTTGEGCAVAGLSTKLEGADVLSDWRHGTGDWVPSWRAGVRVTPAPAARSSRASLHGTSLWRRKSLRVGPPSRGPKSRGQILRRLRSLELRNSRSHRVSRSDSISGRIIPWHEDLSALKEMLRSTRAAVSRCIRHDGRRDGRND